MLFVALLLMIIPQSSAPLELIPFVVLILIIYRPLKEWSRYAPTSKLGDIAFQDWQNFYSTITQTPFKKPIQIHKTLLQIQNLDFKYKLKKVFKKLSISFETNKVHLVKGKNGTGKSTLLKLIARVEFASQGSIFYPQIFSDYSHGGIGYLPQSLSFEFDWKQRLNHFGAKNPIYYQELKAILGIDKLELIQLDQLSGGEIQRVALLVVFSQQKPCLLLDEPGHSIAYPERIEILKNLIDLWKKHWGQLATLIIVSHDQEIQDFCDQIKEL